MVHLVCNNVFSQYVQLEQFKSKCTAAFSCLSSGISVVVLKPENLQANTDTNVMLIISSDVILWCVDVFICPSFFQVLLWREGGSVLLVAGLVHKVTDSRCCSGRCCVPIWTRLFQHQPSHVSLIYVYCIYSKGKKIFEPLLIM